MADSSCSLNIEFFYLPPSPKKIEKQRVGLILKQKTTKEGLICNADLIKYEINKGSWIVISCKEKARICLRAEIYNNCIVGYSIGPLSRTNKKEEQDHFLSEEVDLAISTLITRAFSEKSEAAIYHNNVAKLSLRVKQNILKKLNIHSKQDKSI